MLENNQLMLKTRFHDRALSSVNEQINVEKRKGGSGSRSAASAVTNASYNSFLDARREFLKKVCQEVLRQSA